MKSTKKKLYNPLRQRRANNRRRDGEGSRELLPPPIRVKLPAGVAVVIFVIDPVKTVRHYRP